MRERREFVPVSLEELPREENEEKERLLFSGFLDWNRNEFAAFLRACEKFSRSEFEKIADVGLPHQYIETKTVEQVKTYSEVFWQRFRELPEYDKIVKNIERGEEAIRQKQLSIELITKKCKNRKFYDEIDFNNNIYSKFRSRFYSIDHDKYLIFASNKFGYGYWKDVRMGIKREDAFEFDSYFKSRTESELNKRMASLLKVIKAEFDHERKLDQYRRQADGSDPEDPKPQAIARLSNIEEEDLHGGESLVEEIDVENIASQDNSSSKPAKHALSRGKAREADRAAKSQKPGQEGASTSQLKKRKPETDDKRDLIRKPHKPQSSKPQPPEARQPTISSYFQSADKPADPQN